MAENEKPPALPAEPDTSASAPNPSRAAAGDGSRLEQGDSPKLSPRQRALKAERDRLAELAKHEEDRKKFHADLKAHLAEANQEERNTNEPPHPHVHEHAKLRGFDAIQVLDPETMQWVERPCWQMQALVARFHAHGLRHDARISHEQFEKALHEALHGRV